jgi:hypothetical protein
MAASSSPLSSRVAKPNPHSTSPRNASPFSASRTALVDGEGALGAERLELAPVVGQRVAHARDRDGEEAMSRIDAFAELRDRRAALDFLHAPVLDICDEEAGGVRAEVDRRNAHHLRGTAPWNANRDERA